MRLGVGVGGAVVDEGDGVPEGQVVAESGRPVAATVPVEEGAGVKVDGRVGLSVGRMDGRRDSSVGVEVELHAARNRNRPARRRWR